MFKKVMMIATLSVVALTVNSFAQGEKKAPAKKGGIPILQPQMTVDTGTYSAPAGKLGEKTAQPWSATTVGAAVDGKANPGIVKTLVGEIVDFSCYLQVGKHGEKHRACGQKCFTNGQPIGLLTEDGNLYMLMEEEHDPRRDGLTEFRKAATDHVAHIMEVTGTQSTHAGYRALFVTGFLKK
jgi:hypothetical protein